MRSRIAVAALGLLTSLLAAQTRLAVTVIDSKSGMPVTGLKAADFTALDDKTPRQVLSAEYQTDIIDTMLLLDASLVGETVRPVAADLIGQLAGKEQMAIISFASAADLIQDFTSSKDLLLHALSKVKYGNSPSVLDALYAALDGGFEHAAFRRTLLLVTTGVEGSSRVTEQSVVKLARRNGVSIYVVYATGYERSMFEKLSRQTGGSLFNLRDMSKSSKENIGKRIVEVMRSRYLLSVQGNLGLGEKFKVEVRQPGKLFVSALPLE